MAGLQDAARLERGAAEELRVLFLRVPEAVPGHHPAQSLEAERFRIHEHAVHVEDDGLGLHLARAAPVAAPRPASASGEVSGGMIPRSCRPLRHPRSLIPDEDSRVASAAALM